MKTRTEANRKTLYTVLSVIVCALAMSFVDAVIQPQYFVKSMIKLLLFLVLPSIYFFVNRGEAGEVKKLFLPSRKSLVTAAALGVAVYAVIVGGYFLLKNIFDFSGIVGKLTADTGVSADNFLYVALYISFVNSFLEEFLFRGFAFITLKRTAARPFAYIFSAAMFAIYHAGMTAGYFHIGIFLLTLTALFVAGLMFDFLNEKSGNIYTSWLVHMFANFGINTVGMILFGIL